MPADDRQRGWPLTIIMTPEKKPFFAGTYLPKESRSGRIGMLDLVPRIKKMWGSQPKDINRLSDEVTAALRHEEAGLPGSALDEAVLQAAYEELCRRFDEQHGGFGAAPKFPTRCIIFSFSLDTGRGKKTRRP